MHRVNTIRVALLLCALCAATATAGIARADDSAALSEVLAAEQARPAAKVHPRRDFLLQSAISAVTLSPDGRHVAWLRKDASGQVGLWLMDTASRKSRRLLLRTDARQLYFSHDGHWLLLESAASLFAVALDGKQSRLLATLGGPERRRLAAVDPVRPAAVLIVEHDGGPAHWQLLRIDMHGERSVLYRDTHEISGFALSRSGKLAWVQRVEGDALVVGRLDSSGTFQLVRRCEDLQVCQLLPITKDNGAAWMISNADADADLAGLVRLGVDGTITPLASDPKQQADIDEVVVEPASGQPLIASYRSTVAANHGLNATMRDKVQAIAQHFPGRDIVISVGRGAQARWLLAERGDELQGTRWHLYDPREDSFQAILDIAPFSPRNGQAAQWLPPEDLARKMPLSWVASDGMRLYGYVTVPPGRDPAKLPLVALIHGGPWSAVGPGFDSGAQFLANRGYAVFEPNFRGSTKHGYNYQMSADGDFGGDGRVQRDIVEGVRHVLKQGIGDTQRVGIVGASFGGYSTLLGVSFDADLFKVGVAGVPPTDFGQLLQWFVRGSYANSMSRFIPFKDLLRLLHLDVDDARIMARLHAGSPMGNVDRMRRPLTIVAAGRDRRVPIGGVIEYAARLKLAHKKVSLYVDPDADHSARKVDRREAWLYLLAKTLHQTLGGQAPAQPDARLGTYLDRTRRFAAPDTDAPRQ